MLTRSGWEPRLLLPLLVHSLRLTTGWPLPRLLLTPRSWPFSAESSRHLVRDLLLSSAMWSAEVRDSPLLATCGIPSFPFLFFSVATKVEIASGEMQQRYAATFWSLGNLSTFGSLGNLSRSPTQKRRLWNSGYISLNDENILCHLQLYIILVFIKNTLRTLEWIQYWLKYLGKGSCSCAYDIEKHYMPSSSIGTQRFQWAQSVLEVEILLCVMPQAGNSHRIQLILNNRKNFKLVTRHLLRTS